MDILICELCGLEVEQLHKHHLIPQQKSKGMDCHLKCATIDCCKPCSKQVHALFTNNELKNSFNTLEKLRIEPRVQKWINWRRKHPVRDIRYSGKRY